MSELMGRPWADTERPRVRTPASSTAIGGRLPRAVTEPNAASRSGAYPEANLTAGETERFLCEECGDVIGVYEPLVVHDGQDARTTSRAAEPHLLVDQGTYHHRECHAAATLTPPR